MYSVELLQPTYMQDRAAEYSATLAKSAAAAVVTEQPGHQRVASGAVPSATKPMNTLTHPPGPVAHPSAMTQILQKRPIPVRGSSGVFENIFHGFKAVAAASRTSSPASGSSGYSTPSMEKTEAETLLAQRERLQDIDTASVPTLMRPW